MMRTQSLLNCTKRPLICCYWIGCSYFYGYKAVKSFLRRNDLVCLVRAHEVQEEGTQLLTIGHITYNYLISTDMYTGYRKHFDPEIMEKKVRSLNKKLEKANTMDAGRLSEGGHPPLGSWLQHFMVLLLFCYTVYTVHRHCRRWWRCSWRT